MDIEKNAILVRDVKIPRNERDEFQWASEQEVFNKLGKEFPEWELVSVIAISTFVRRVYMKPFAK